jgi:AAA family ATP:ADP antiporter
MRRLASLHGEPPPASQQVATLADAFRGGAQVWRSRYLLAIAAVMCFDILTSTYLYRAQGQAAKALLADDQARAEFFATVDLGANLLVLALEVFVVGQMLRKVGVGLALAALALVSFGSVAALALAPGLLVLGIAQVLRRGIEFGLAKPAREVLFTVVPRQQKYEAKAFIDTVVNRGSDVAVLWTLSLLPNVDARAVAFVAMPLAVAWVWLSVRLGRAFAHRARG